MIIVGIIFFIILLIFIFSKLILNTVFGKRCEGNPNLKYYTAEDFDGLNSKTVKFTSNKGQTLNGNIYTNRDVNEYKGIVVFVHGMGAGHLSYTTEINTLAKAGFMVIGYDNTGTCSSEGKSLKGFFQAVIDLKYALNYISEDENLNKYNVVLMGHSWGAYTVCQVLQYNTKVKAIVAMSGFNNASKLICDSMKNQTKINFNFLKPFITIINFFEFGKEATYNTVDILEKTNIPVLLFHGEKDTSVLIENSLVKAEKLKVKSNIKRIVYEERYHNIYQTKQSEKYLNDIFEEITQLNKKYKGKIPTEESDKIYGSMDYKKITEEDKEVMDIIIKFFEENLK